MIDGWYQVYPVDSGKYSKYKWGVFELGGEYLYRVFETKEEAQKWAEEKNNKIDEIEQNWKNGKQETEQ